MTLVETNDCYSPDHDPGRSQECVCNEKEEDKYKRWEDQ